MLSAEYPWAMSAHRDRLSGPPSSGTLYQSQLLHGGGVCGDVVLASHALNHMSRSSQAQLSKDREALTPEAAVLSRTTETFSSRELS